MFGIKLSYSPLFSCQEVKNYYLDKRAEEGTLFSIVDIAGDEVSLDIPVEGKSLSHGWSIHPEVYPTKVSIQGNLFNIILFPTALIALPLQVIRESVDNYQAGRTIPACHVQLVWENGKEHLKKLSCMLPVRGVKPDDTHIRVSRIPALQGMENCIY